MLSSSKVSFWEGHFGGFAPQRTFKFGQNKCLTYNFLHCEFHLSMLNSLKVLFLGGRFEGYIPTGGLLNLVKITVSHATSYIVSFDFLC